MRYKIRNENDGFTLIELVITIAVLAVISVPLLMYFTDSMRHSARMKEEQNAVVAAQNVLEELKVVDMSLDTPDYLTQTATLPPGATPYPTTSVTWSEVSSGSTPGPSETPAPVGSSYEVKGQYSLNKQVYTVKAKITPRHDLENDTHATVTYHKAKAPGMDSSKDMIATEKDIAIEEAKSFFYQQYTKECDDNNLPRNASVRLDEMDQKIKRKIHIKAEPETDASSAKTGKVILIVTYEYEWNSGSLPIDATHDFTPSVTFNYEVKRVVLDGVGMHNIFLFYMPFHYQTSPSATPVFIDDEVILEGQLTKVTKAIGGGATEVLLGDAGTADDNLQYRLYLVADGTVSRTGSTYKTNLSTSTVAADNFGNYISEVYTSLDSGELISGSYAINSVFPASVAADHGFHYQTLLEMPEVNRIADIEVSVYKGDSVDEGNRYTTVNGTKVQNQ